MPSEPKKPQHWPFSDGAAESDPSASSHAMLDRMRARKAMQSANHARIRNDRLIVGGRAHTKKPGLS